MKTEEIIEILNGYNQDYIKAEIFPISKSGNFQKFNNLVTSSDCTDREFGKITKIDEKGIYADKNGNERIILRNPNNKEDSGLPYVYYFIIYNGKLYLVYSDVENLDFNAENASKKLGMFEIPIK